MEQQELLSQQQGHGMQQQQQQQQQEEATQAGHPNCGPELAAKDTNTNWMENTEEGIRIRCMQAVPAVAQSWVQKTHEILIGYYRGGNLQLWYQKYKGIYNRCMQAILTVAQSGLQKTH
eukprot:1159215-Pelagomonas_calceolata.AAC.6